MSQLRILIVDDDCDAAEAFQELLRVLGYEPAIRHDVASALEYAVAERPDVVLSDLSLQGGLEGLALARQLRAELGEECPMLLAVTGHGGADVREASLKAGFDRHFIKPIDLFEFERLLQSRALGSTPRHGAVTLDQSRSENRLA